MTGMDMEMPKVNCVILGEKGTGKTSFINRHLSGEFKNVDIKTENKENELIFYTNRGPICFVMWDKNGEEIIQNKKKINPDCAIILFDTTSSLSYNKVYEWELSFLCSAPFANAAVICENMVDLEGSVLTPEKDCYLKISVKKNFNLGAPFLWLARKLSGDPLLKFVPMPAPQPPEMEFSNELLCKLAKERRELFIQQAMKIDLPDTI
ncbi:GTP-binding nuclear protein Ran-like [Drosophila obscura]|uniref:GTP-binding nuclear protein Ran-like n=1 Tax=Drosophila obscura TaxID=7282 RepID=UPI001BB0FC83|nr:GTP-binding nuclear protein Ran-like [Drosophila obscura]